MLILFCFVMVLWHLDQNVDVQSSSKSLSFLIGEISSCPALSFRLGSLWPGVFSAHWLWRHPSPWQQHTQRRVHNLSWVSCGAPKGLLWHGQWRRRLDSQCTILWIFVAIPKLNKQWLKPMFCPGWVVGSSLPSMTSYLKYIWKGYR